MALQEVRSKTTLAMSLQHYQRHNHKFSNSSLNHVYKENLRTNLATGFPRELMLLRAICSSQIQARKIDQARV